MVRDNVITGATGYGIHLYDEDKDPGFTPAYSDIVVENNRISTARLRERHDRQRGGRGFDGAHRAQQRLHQPRRARHRP